MNYTVNNDGSTKVVQMSGQFTFSDHTDFRSVINDFEAEQGGVALDLGGVEFIDSAALGLLLLAREEAERLGIKLEIRNSQGQVKKMLEVSKFDTLFDIK